MNRLIIIEYFNEDIKHDNLKGLKCGFIAYDYKNEIEKLTSKNTNKFTFPNKFFFEPKYFLVADKQLIAADVPISDLNKKFDLLFDDCNTEKIILKSKETKAQYIDKIKRIKKHLQRGDVYEINYCHEFFVENLTINPYALYLKLKQKSPAPFACFVKYFDNYLIGASPERFLKKTGNKLIAQPIKGTIKRGADAQTDEILKNHLKNDPKERSENTMIVDLVRNDLSKIAQRNSVKVDELCEIYSFKQVHQMISTISCNLKKDVSFDEIIRATFPMGSMTGAPKIKAMELIDELEETKRGMYSGTVGYILPNGDFDFNVVIRSILYNAQKKYLSFMVGGAITIKSDPEKEYEETLLKAKAIFEVLNEL
ncbi:MAG: anthranilate synthase component I family protein [Vicingaceae bacterium]